MPFRDRRDAGRRLGERLAPWRDRDPVVVGLPRGGVPVACEVARALSAPVDVLVVRKLGYPPQPELGLGAIGEGGVRVVNEDLVARLGVDRAVLDRVAADEGAELARRVERFRGGRPRVALEGRPVIVVDDGLATGYTARAAIEVLRASGATEVILAVPVAPPETARALRADADAVVALETPERFHAIGEWYDDFAQVPDDDVAGALAAMSGPA